MIVQWRGIIAKSSSPLAEIAGNSSSASRAAMGKPKASFFPLSSGHELIKHNGHLRSVACGSSSLFVVSDASASVRSVAGKLEFPRFSGHLRGWCEKGKA